MLRRQRGTLWPTFTALCLSALWRLGGAFPDYQDPITAEPRLDRGPPSLHLCTRDLIRNAACKSYTGLETSQYEPPGMGECGGPGAVIGKVVIDFRGSVRGTQYDRFGVLFLGGVELLRLTTPEPMSNKTDLHWSVEKDVTDYVTLFKKAGQAAVFIPNVVDETYTGVIYVDVTVSFYAASWAPLQQYAHQDPASLPSFVIPITQPTIASPDDPSAAMRVSGAAPSLQRTMTLPGDTQTVELFLDLYASPHGCEEFYWSNVPDEVAASDKDLCGGGTYRELHVTIDGQLAGTIMPFPAVYTGGISPPLWRPLTGIMSFNIPAYRFDLSPFLGLLNDKRPHNFTLSVLNSSDKGYWVLNGVLLGRTASDVAPGVSPPGWVNVEDSGVVVWQDNHWQEEEGKLTAVYTARRRHVVTGARRMPDGSERTTTITTRMRFHNHNHAEGQAVSVSRQRMWQERETRVEQGGVLLSHRVDSELVPLDVTSVFTNGTEAFQLDGYVNHSYHRSTTWWPRSPPYLFTSLLRGPRDASQTPFTIAWANKIVSSGAFNVSHKPKTRRAILTGRAVETFRVTTSSDQDDMYDTGLREVDRAIHASRKGIKDGSSRRKSLAPGTRRRLVTSTSPFPLLQSLFDDGGENEDDFEGGEAPCYSRRLTAENGWITSDHGSTGRDFTGSCVLPQGVALCGAALCGDPTASTPTPQRPAASVADQLRAKWSASHGDQAGEAPASGLKIFARDKMSGSGR